VRSANNGISLICDEQGRLLGSLELGRRGVVTAAVAPGRADTLFVLWASWPLAVLLVLWAGACVAWGPKPEGGR